MNTIAVTACLMFAFSSLGCVAVADLGDAEADGPLGEIKLAAGTYNGLSWASVKSAPLTTVSSYRIDLLDHALNGASLSPAVKGLLAGDAASNKLMTYAVKCALSSDQSVQFTANGVARRYDGQHGLASSWNAGTCGQQCREWVSACVLAHVNHNHVSQPINLVATPFMPDGGYGEYPYEEATYWGDIFESDANQKRYACVNDATRLSRVCGADTTTCGGLLRGSGSAHVLEECPTTCSNELTDGGKANSTYYTGCTVDQATSARTMTVWRND